MDEVFLKAGGKREVKDYQSGVGSLIYYSADCELVAYACKELARSIHDPSAGDAADLKRCARWLAQDGDLCHDNLVDESVLPVPWSTQRLKVHVLHDADHAGSWRDRRSTTGVRVQAAGFKLSHVSTTQPGLPAISTGESELRGMTKASAEGLYAKSVFAECGVDVDVELVGDSTAAMQNAAKLGPGKMRHMERNDLFVKEAIRQRLLKIVKAKGTELAADLLTKHLEPKAFGHWLSVLGYRRPTAEERAIKPASLE